MGWSILDDLTESLAEYLKPPGVGLMQAELKKLTNRVGAYRVYIQVACVRNPFTFLHHDLDALLVATDTLARTSPPQERANLKEACDLDLGQAEGLAGVVAGNPVHVADRATHGDRWWDEQGE